ncbi:hypothetical protein ANN_08591 [Periplaneta americana]|uniref:Uncharacterized protein n=1 Tax=Periplaneta americana TaxID=6978 RepID=A0ABQ8T3F4_PERAM|nr:hypothetical protein ANN_08591 [Periplaneta americana]
MQSAIHSRTDRLRPFACQRLHPNASTCFTDSRNGVYILRQASIEGSFNRQKKTKQEKTEFVMDTTKMFLSANIPTEKVDDPAVRTWFLKYVPDFWLWGNMKELVYATPIDNAQTLQDSVFNAYQHKQEQPGQFQRVRDSLHRRPEKCIAMNGHHIEHFL